MQQIRSHADIILSLEGLVTAAKDNAATLPSTPPHLVALEQALTDLKSVKMQQNANKANKQKSTQDLRGLIKNAQELAVRLRGAVKADLGPRTEQLVNYGIVPIRKRASKAVATPPVTPPAPTPTGVTPTTTPKPAA